MNPPPSWLDERGQPRPALERWDDDQRGGVHRLIPAGPLAADRVRRRRAPGAEDAHGRRRGGANPPDEIGQLPQSVARSK